MIRVAVCDDDQLQINILINYIEEWGNNNNIRVKIDYFKNGEAFLFEWYGDKQYDIVFLDIEMNKKSGLEVAKLIREKDQEIDVVFVTGFFKFALDGYKLKALRYLLKPIKKNDLFDCLDCSYEKRFNKDESKYIIVKVDKELTKLFYNDILYCIMFSPYIDIHSSKEKITLRKKISDIEKELPSDMFVKCHRSYLVNLKYVKLISKNFVTLDNGVKIPISRGKYKEVNEKFLSYNIDC